MAEGRDASTIVRWIGAPLVLVRDAEEARDIAARMPAERLAMAAAGEVIRMLSSAATEPRP